MKSRCCKADVIIGGDGDTHWHECTRCRQACQILLTASMDIDIPPLDNCKHGEETFGMICIKCNECGRFEDKLGD